MKLKDLLSRFENNGIVLIVNKLSNNVSDNGTVKDEEVIWNHELHSNNEFKQFGVNANYIYLKKNDKKVPMCSIGVFNHWNEFGIKHSDLVHVRSLLSYLNVSNDVVPFLELFRSLISEYGSWADYIKAVIQIENEQVPSEMIEKAYDFFVETDDCTLISPMIDEYIAEVSLEEEETVS